MNSDSAAILMVGHGSPRQEANAGFISMVERTAARLGVPVQATFFSLARPSIEDQIARLAGEGVRRIVIMPYFLYNGQHVSRDIPGLLAKCRAEFPQVQIEVLPTLEGEPALLDLVVERLLPYSRPAPLPTEGRAIERRSHEIIDQQLGPVGAGETAERSVIRRVIHATADFSFARSMRIHPAALEQARNCLAAGKPIICDVRMLQAGITHSRSEAICAIGEPQVVALARERKITRAAAAMEFFGERLEGAIVAIGNAPTALWKVMEMAASGGPRPALVVGLPVGFVGARESKLALIDSGLCYVTNTSSRGGSPAAAAAVNALALLGKDDGNE